MIGEEQENISDVLTTIGMKNTICSKINIVQIKFILS